MQHVVMPLVCSATKLMIKLIIKLPVSVTVIWVIYSSFRQHKAQICVVQLGLLLELLL